MNVVSPMILDSSGNVLRRIDPVDVSLDLQLEPLSSAEIELKPGDTIPERSWVSVYTEHGLAGIFRSRPQRDRYGERSSRVSLVHGAVELNDYITTKGGDQEQDPANTAIAYIMQFYLGTHWRLGTVSATSSVVYQLNGSGVLDAITEIMEQLPGYMLVFDQSVTPWTLNVLPRPETVSAEGRLSRNISSVEISRDDSSLCTRVYYGENDLFVEDAASIQKYGVIEYRINDSGLTNAQLAAIAQAYLDNHKASKLSVSISAIDFYNATGEPLDRITLGSKYRLAIPNAETEENRVIEAIICSIHYDSVRSRNPQITLASDPDTIITFLKKQRRSGGSARQIAKEEADKQYQHWTTENNVYKESVYKIMGVKLDEYGNVVYQKDPVTGELILDDAGNPKPVYDSNSGGSLSGITKETAQNYTRLYELTGVNALGENETILTRVQQDARQYAIDAVENNMSGYLQITALKNEMGNVFKTSDGKTIVSSIVTTINGENSEIYLNSDHVKLKDGSIITASTLDSRLANIDALFTTNGYAAQIKAGTINSGGNINADGAVYGTGIYIKSGTGGGTNVQYADVSNAVKTIRKDTSLADGLIGFEFQTLTGTSWTKVNFNIADTSYYQAHVGIDPTKLVLQEIGATPYNASTADEITGIAAGNDPKYFLITATPKDGNTVYKKFILPAASAPTVTTDPKISKKSWSSGQIQLDASSDPNDPSSVTIKLTGGTTGSLDSAANPTKISFDILESVNGSTVDTGADVVASVTRQAATLKLGTYNNTPAIVANMVGRATVGGQVIQVGVTHLPVTPGTATPNTPTWNTSTHKYAITADGSVSIGSDSLALTRGSLSGDFSPTHAFTYGFNECFNSVELTAAKTTINPGETVDVIPKMKGTWDASAAQAFSGKKLTITAAQAATVTPKVSKKTWSSSGTLTFEASTASGDPTSAGVALGWVTVPNTSNGNASLSVVDKASPYSSAQPHTVLTKALTLTCEDDAAYLKDGGTTIAKVPNNKTAAPVTVNVEKGSWSSGAIQFTTDPASGTGKNVSLGMTIPANTSNGNAQITIVDKASPGSSSQPLSTGLTKTLTLTCEDDAAYLKDGNTTVAKVPNNKTTPTVSASIDLIELRTVGGVQYRYDKTEKDFTIYVQASGTNVSPKTDGQLHIGGSAAFNHGRDSVTITNVERVASCAIDEDAQTAEQDVRFTLSNGETYTIHEDFSDVYRAGRNGTAIDTFVDYAVDLSSGGVVFDPGVEEDADGDPLRIDLSDIYQAGQSYTPPVKHWYTYSSTGGDVPIYVRGGGSGSSDGVIGSIYEHLNQFHASTSIAFYPYTPVEVVGSLLGYTQVSYGGKTYYVDPSNLKQSETDLSIGQRVGIKDLSVYVTSLTLSRVVHTAGPSNSITLTVQRDGDRNPSNQVSSYVSLREFNGLTVNANAGNYYDYLSYLNGYYASHDAAIYGDNLAHKAVFVEHYSDGTDQTIIVSFDSYAYAAESQRVWWEITNYYNNYGFDTPVTFTPANGPEQTLAYSEGYSSLTVSGEDASTYIPGDITYAWNSNYYQQMTCRFRVRWHLSDGKTEDIIIKKVAHMEEAPSPDAFTGYVYATNGGSVKVRATAGGSEIGSLTPNTQVTVLSKEGSYYKIEFEGVQGYMVSSYVINSSGSPSNYKYTGWVKDIAYVEIVVASNGSDQIVHAGGYTGTIVIDLAPAGMGKTNYRSLNAISALYNSFSPAITGSLSYYLGTVNNYGNLATHSKNIYKSNLTHRLRAIVHYADGTPSDSVILQFTSVPV